MANFSSYNKTDGSLATVIIFLVWMWITQPVLAARGRVRRGARDERALREGVPENDDLFAVAKDTRKSDDDEKRAAERVEARRSS